MQNPHYLSQAHEDDVFFFRSQSQLYKCLGIENRSAHCIAKNAPFCRRPINKDNLKARPQLLERLLKAKIPSTQAHDLLEEISHCVVCGVTKWHQPKAERIFKNWRRRLWADYLCANGLDQRRCRWVPKRLDKDVWVRLLNNVRSEQQSLSNHTRHEIGRADVLSDGPNANIPPPPTTTTTLDLDFDNDLTSCPPSHSPDHPSQESHRQRASAALEDDGLRFESSPIINIYRARMTRSGVRLQVYRDPSVPASSTRGASSSASSLTSHPRSSPRPMLREQNRNARLRRRTGQASPGPNRPCLDNGSTVEQGSSSTMSKAVLATSSGAKLYGHGPRCDAGQSSGRPMVETVDEQSNDSAVRECVAHAPKEGDTESYQKEGESGWVVVNAAAEDAAIQPDENGAEMRSRLSEEEDDGAGDGNTLPQSSSFSDTPDKDDLVQSSPSPSPGPPNFRLYQRQVSSRANLMSILNGISQYSGPRNRAPGYIYAFSRPNIPGFFKIGYTNAIKKPSRRYLHPVDNRLARWTSDCGHPVTEIFRVYMPSAAGRMESLIHQTLREHRRVEDPACRSCRDRKGRGGAHDEWFEVDPETARKTVDVWLLFSTQMPYDAWGRAVDFWARKAENDRRGVDHGICVDGWLEDMPRYVEQMLRQDLILFTKEMFTIAHYVFWLILALQGGISIPFCMVGVYVLFIR